MPATPANNTCYSLSRTALVNGTTVFEKYTDGDGDGYLFGPDLSQLSAAQFSIDSKIVSPGRADFSGIYTGGNGQKTTISVLFDAGNDYRFSTTDGQPYIVARQAKNG